VIKVVHQSAGYWLNEAFGLDADGSNTGGLHVETRRGILFFRPATRESFASLLKGRVSGWVVSEPKSVSVFVGSLALHRQIRAHQLYSESVVAALHSIANQVTARTGAQGQNRLPAEVDFLFKIHLEAKDGRPQLHAHIAIEDRVRLQDGTATYATDKRELYRLRRAFAAALVHEFGHRLQKEFGVRVRKTRHGLVLPDVPKSLCKRSSVRTDQINGFLKRNAIANTPHNRQYAALVTRRENRDPAIGRRDFQSELTRTGFRGETICHRVSPNRTPSTDNDAQARETRRVRSLVQQLARDSGIVTHESLRTRALETARLSVPRERIDRAVETVLKTPRALGLQPIAREHGQTVYLHRNHAKRWKAIVAKIEHLIADSNGVTKPRSPAPAPNRIRNSAKADGTNETAAPRPVAPNEHPNQKPRRSPERGTDLKPFVESVLRSCNVVGAVGRLGLEAAKAAIELWEIWRKPIWNVHGRGHKNEPGSVAQMVRDLKPLSRLEAHKAAAQAMLKFNGGLTERLQYGEHVYRQSRRAKFRIPRGSLIVIRDVEAARRKDLDVLLQKARRAKAKVLFVDRNYRRSILVSHARSLRNGEHRHVHGPELSR
jgi:hypothetical protein